MSTRSLNELNEYLVERILHLTPSIVQVLALRNTDVHFRQLCQNHMMRLTCVDFRTPFDSSRSKLSSLKLFGNKLRKVKCEAEMDIDSLTRSSHPYLFPKYRDEFFVDIYREYHRLPPLNGISGPARRGHGYRRYDDREICETDYVLHVEQATLAYELLFSKICQVDSGYYEVIARYERLSVTRDNLESLCMFVTSRLDFSRYVEDFSKIHTLALNSPDHDLPFGDDDFLSSMGTQGLRAVFPGLKLFVIRTEICMYGSEWLPELLAILAGAPFEVTVEPNDDSEIGGIDFKETEVVEVRGSRFKYMGHVTDNDAPSFKSSAIFMLEYQRISFSSVTKANLVKEISKNELAVTSSTSLIPVTEYLSKYLENNGGNLIKLCISEEFHWKAEITEEQIKLLFETIACNCKSLKTLHLKLHRWSPVYFDCLRELLSKVGRTLTDLVISSQQLPMDAVVDVIADTCKKLKHLYLNLAFESDDEKSRMNNLEKLHHLKQFVLKDSRLSLGGAE